LLSSPGAAGKARAAGAGRPDLRAAVANCRWPAVRAYWAAPSRANLRAVFDRRKGQHVSAKPISRFSVPDLFELPEDIRERIVQVQEKSGFVPNVFLALARRPDEFRAFFAYHDALMDKPGGLTKAEREMIVVATSAANQCHYCVVAHGAILRIRAKNPLVADQVAVNYRKADVTAKQKAMLDFALAVATRSQEIGDAEFAALEAHGFAPEDAWDIIGIASFFAMSNRLANAANIRPNDEFYTMGRGEPAER
jgi:uncharacterized peroxidase-related enzyme